MSAELRPRIKIISQLSRDEIINRLKEKLKDQSVPFSGWAKEGYALISPPVNKRQIWTPQLNLQIEEVEEGTEVRGVIGPGASVWTAFAFSFSILGFIAFVALFWGLSRLSLDYSADILWVVPVTLLLIIGLYMLARIGQELSSNEVKGLREFIESLLKDKS